LCKASAAAVLGVFRKSPVGLVAAAAVSALAPTPRLRLVLVPQGKETTVAPELAAPLGQVVVVVVPGRSVEVLSALVWPVLVATVPLTRSQEHLRFMPVAAAAVPT
jgi:hypothetical protein